MYMTPTTNAVQEFLAQHLYRRTLLYSTLLPYRLYFTASLTLQQRGARGQFLTVHTLLYFTYFILLTVYTDTDHDIFSPLLTLLH
jgi:hypothetical protein